MKPPRGQLVLIEGLPGTGKTPTAKFLHAALHERGLSCEVFYEGSDDNPIDIGSVPNDLVEVIAGYPEKTDFLGDWQELGQFRLRRDVTIIESRFLQNSAMFLLMNGRSHQEVVQHVSAIAGAIRDTHPLLVYLSVDDAAAHIRQVLHEESAEWVERVTAACDTTPWMRRRGLSGQVGFVEFFRGWGRLLDTLIAGLDFEHVRIENPRTQWPAAITRLVDKVDTY